MRDRYRKSTTSGTSSLLAPEHHVALDAGLLVEALEGKIPARGRAPVGHYVARVAPGALENVVEQVAVPAGVLAVDLVVAAHDRARVGALDRHLEGEQV